MANLTDDPITREVVRNALTSVADEMALTVIRTAHSQVVRDTMDFSTALFNARGQLVTQGLTLPLHLGAMPDAMRGVLDRFGDSLKSGDVIVLNDPEEGGMHLQDIFMFRPCFDDGHLVGFAACVAHQADMGGRVAGSNAVDSTEIFQEGLQIPILKLYDGGVPNQTLFRILGKNVRIPDIVLGDVRAQLAACYRGEQALLKLCDTYGRDSLESLIQGILDHTETAVRQELRDIPDGDYVFKDYIDDDGLGSDPITIEVKLSFRDDEVAADFAGTSPQVKAALNGTLSVAKSIVYAGLRCAMTTPNLLVNDGFFRAVSVSAPKGTILNPNPPAPRAARGLTSFRMLDAIFGALHQALPDRIPAAGEGGATMLAMGGFHEDGQAIVFVDFACGGWGARPNSDGIEGVSPLAANLANVPVEVIELQHPVRVEQYGFVPDTGGPGTFRGCLSVLRELRYLGATGVVQMRSDRRRFPPYGLAGGHPGSPSRNFLNPDSANEVLPTKFTRPIQKGDVIRHITAGGGGFGDPSHRARGRIIDDLLDEKVSLNHVREAYGVDIREEEFRDHSR